MKIGFDAKRAFHNRTGLGNYARFVLNALAQHAPTERLCLYTPSIGTQLSNGGTPLLDFARLPPTVFQQKLHPIWRSFWVVDQLKKDQIEVFHGLSNELPVGLQQNGIKSVVTIHDLIFERYPQLFPAIDRFFYRQKFKAACSQADIVVAVSQQTKRDIVAYYGIAPSRIEVVYQDCDDIFKQRLSENELVAVKQKYALTDPYILSVGSIETRKNQLQLVRAFRAANLPNAQLVLVGRATNYQTQIEKYIEEHKLGQRVRILNGVTFADLPALYQAAKLAAYVSIFEGFGIPVVEALHSGVPVLAATGSCLEESGGGGGLYVDPFSEADMAQKLQNLWSDAALRQQLVADGQRHVAQFSAPLVAAQLVKLYHSLG